MKFFKCYYLTRANVSFVMYWSENEWFLLKYSWYNWNKLSCCPLVYQRGFEIHALLVVTETQWPGQTVNHRMELCAGHVQSINMSFVSVTSNGTAGKSRLWTVIHFLSNVILNIVQIIVQFSIYVLRETK